MIFRATTERSPIENEIIAVAMNAAGEGDSTLFDLVNTGLQWSNLKVFEALSALAKRSDNIGERARSLVAEFGAIFLGVGT